MKTSVKIQKRTVPLGAGLYSTRWAVIQDGRFLEMFSKEEEATNLLSTLINNWESKDE